jgi:hypothetical protein
LGLLVYVGIQFVMPFYNHFKFKSEAEYVVKFTVKDEAEMRQRLVDKAEEAGLSIPLDDFVLEQTQAGFNMKVSWSNTVDLFGKYQKKFDFSVEILE